MERSGGTHSVRGRGYRYEQHRHHLVQIQSGCRLLRLHQVTLLFSSLHLSCNLFSPNEARILSRKAGPSSRLFLLLKPFSPLLWSLMAAVFLLFFFLFLAFKRMNEKYFGLRTERRDSVWVFTGLFHVMLRPACLISPSWPRSSHYLYLAFQLFFYFMLHFFYLVS